MHGQEGGGGGVGEVTCLGKPLDILSPFSSPRSSGLHALFFYSSEPRLYVGKEACWLFVGKSVDFLEAPVHNALCA